jgi:bifunctional UDP-N-acetylglucosamine pyrophosphorylase/glucosamine-1-phosphate N-acetyltransferase
VLAAADALARGADDVLIIFGDTPLIRPQTLRRMRDALAKGRPSRCSAFRPKDPTGYGRLVMKGSELVAIREELDATPAERAIDLCNGGLMALPAKTAMTILSRIGNDNRKGEFYSDRCSHHRPSHEAPVRW